MFTNCLRDSRTDQVTNKMILQAIRLNFLAYMLATPCLSWARVLQHAACSMQSYDPALTSLEPPMDVLVHFSCTLRCIAAEQQELVDYTSFLTSLQDLPSQLATDLWTSCSKHRDGFLGDHICTHRIQQVPPLVLFAAAVCD